MGRSGRGVEQLKTSFGIEIEKEKSMTDKTYEKIFAKLSGHFLTQELPDNWRDFDEDYLEEWFTECALDTYQYWEWDEVYDMIDRIVFDLIKLGVKL